MDRIHSWADSHMRLASAFAGRLPRGSASATAALALAALAVVSGPAQAVTKHQAAGTMNVMPAATLAESVINGSGLTSTTGWRGDSGGGTIGIRPDPLI